MWSIAPTSVMLLAVLGLLIVALATTRMAVLEHKLRRTSHPATSHRPFVRSSA